ncbi:MAG: hypothetical protein ABMB14_10140 [Myxococcota bacterium]
MRVTYVVGCSVLALPLLGGCNRYDLFRVAGYQQQSFSNRADILFVVDNSDSMLEESSSLAANFAGFIGKIDEVEQELAHDGLPDAVTNFVDYVQNRSAYIDYQFGITTTDVDTDGGELQGPVVARGEADVPNRFVETLACESTCFSSAAVVPSDPDYQCGQPLGEYLSEEFLDCQCANSWRGNCGAANEEGIEATFLAMCRAVPNPPVDCFADIIDDEGNTIPARLDQGDVGSNAGLLRDNANFIPVIVTDEGDGSRRIPGGDEIPEAYNRLFSQFNTRMSWVFIGPGQDASNKVVCPGTATDWGVTRYNYMVHTTDGLSIDIYDDTCTSRNFESALEELASLLTNLLTSFPLQSVPIPGTIQVLVDGDVVDEASITGQDEFGLDEFDDGWTYRSSDNAIVFHGTAIPAYDAKVEVYYKPVDGMPRELPF